MAKKVIQFDPVAQGYYNPFFFAGERFLQCPLLYLRGSNLDYIIDKLITFKIPV